MARGGLLDPRQRRRQVRRDFDASVTKEWKRHEGEPWHVLRRTIRERFLRQHLARTEGTVLELGPGPGRFTTLLRARPRRTVVAVDLSRACLRAARRRAARRGSLAAVHWLQAAGERLPLGPATMDAVVAFGNIVSFASVDGPALLGELARVLRPGGRLLADFPTPVGSAQEFFHLAARRRFLPRVLRRRTYYFVDRVLAEGFQPFAPARMGRWEFRFYTVQEAHRDLERAGFRVADTLSVAPITRMDSRVVSVARREKRTWESLLTVEERAGRRPGVSESGDGFLLCAVRSRARPQTRRSGPGATRSSALRPGSGSRARSG